MVGSREDRVEMLVAGADELPPRYPIFVRPAVRPDPIDAALWGPKSKWSTILCFAIVVAVIGYLVWQVIRSHGAA